MRKAEYLRQSVDVVTKLLDAMDRIVTDYGDLVRTPHTIREIVDGTSFFPGGYGVWRGEEPHGRIPESFPESPVMFVGNYWFNECGFNQARKHGSEDVKKPTGFWASMRAYVRVCGLKEEDCFFTNALMGLTPGAGPATGRLTGDGPNFRKQCRIFFDEQLKIVQPRIVAVMGDYAKEELSDFFPKIEIPHPSSLRVKPHELDAAAAKKVARLIAAL